MLKVFKKQIAIYRIKIIDFCLFNDHIYFLKKLLNLFNNLTGRKLFFVHLEPLNKTCYADKLSEGKTQNLYGPKYKNGFQAIEKVKLPALNYYKLENVLIHPNTPIILSDSKIAMYQNYQMGDYSIDRIDFKAGFIWANLGKKLVVDAAPKSEVEQGIILVGSWSKNWYHWTIEILSRLELINDLPIDFDHWPLIIPESCMNSNNHIDFLLLINSKRKLIAIKDTTLVKEALYVDSPVISLPKLKNNTEIDRLRIGNFHNDILGAYRSTVLNSFQKRSKLKFKSNDDLPKNILLARKQKNRKYNQIELISSLKQFNFIPIYLEELNVYEQIRYITNAKIIIGPTGAAWANILFANAKLAILWTPEFIKDSPVYSTLANVAGVDLYFLRFKTVAKNWVEFMKSDEEYYVNPEDIASLVNKKLTIK